MQVVGLPSPGAWRHLQPLPKWERSPCIVPSCLGEMHATAAQQQVALQISSTPLLGLCQQSWFVLVMWLVAQHCAVQAISCMHGMLADRVDRTGWFMDDYKVLKSACSIWRFDQQLLHVVPNSSMRQCLGGVGMSLLLCCRSNGSWGGGVPQLQFGSYSAVPRPQLDSGITPTNPPIL
jgi:hypothetical protein